MKTRRAPLVLALLLACSTPAIAQVTIDFAVPGARIGVNLGGYPTLQRIPGYPVYYAPSLGANYFFYDGMYWVYEGDAWYASSWYNGPWGRVDPYYVPDYILRVPVRYYRHAPAYFRGWRADAPPRWDQHWGRSWHDRRRDWDRWDRRSAPAPAPLPIYQREYRGDRYPHFERQAELHARNYRYQPHDPVAREHFQERRAQAERYRGQPAPQPQRDRREERGRMQDHRDDRARPQERREERGNAQERRRESQGSGRPAPDATPVRVPDVGQGG